MGFKLMLRPRLPLTAADSGLRQVTAEGGRDAAIEAPFIYMALDQLALRAQVCLQNCGF